MSPKKRTRWIGYVRVSTQEQADGGVSLAAQQKRIRAWSDMHEIELLDVVADEGASAKNLARPGLQRVLQALREGEADGVVVAKLDRLTRRTRDLLDLVEELCQQRGLGLVSINETIDTSNAAGRLVLTV